MSSDVVIYHNPSCGTSRNTLALLREKGVEPDVVEYLKVGWTLDQLKGLLARMGAKPRDVLRARGTNAEALGLTDPAASDDRILEAMTREPILVERPIVATSKGVALCRPAEKALELL
ncbi:MAG: arsenate reductase (glutaredoxin) [Phenylobacterium sp.]|uniref:arsenate reductase (glutaredoxin) n=1 Tax=Phenylobacterium sp. TaxID=1871053 RepID=UPI0027374D2B|nr:arsenate reductase (glutaredoxin) [Phenylobacterium sp.]MDP3174698.1 arsenate reductase (glutaredoxin) [Phenylobacterium sp.]